MKSIIIQGAGFADNFGDVLFYDIFLKESAKNNINIDFGNISNKVLRHLDYNDSNTKSIFTRIKESDGIVFIGGGYLGEPPHISKKGKYRWGLSKIKDILYIAILGMIFRKKIIIIGPGAGPISNPLTRRIVKLMSNYSEKTIVRDIESYNFLNSIGVNKEKLVETVDTAILLKDYYDINNYDNSKKSLVVHFSNSPGDSPKTMMLLKDIEIFLEKHPEYFLRAITDHNGGGQNKAISFLKDKYKEKIETHIYDSPEKLINFLNSSTVVITNKLHIAIVSSTLGKSVISIPTHTKVLRYFKQINESDRCILYSDIKEGELYRQLEKYHDTTIEIDSLIYDKARTNIDYFNNFIEEL